MIYDEAKILASEYVAAGLPQGQADLRLNNLFADVNDWPESVIRERLAKPAKGRRPSIAATHTILTVAGDR